MFSPKEQQNVQPPKSGIQMKRESFHSQRALQEKEKIKKTMRFDNMTQMVLQKNQADYDFILQVKQNQIEQTLKKLMDQDDSIALILCISKLQAKYSRSQDFLSEDFFRDFVQYSGQKITRPQIIILYDSFAVESQEFRNAVFERKQIVEKIVKEIRSLIQSTSQQIYLRVLVHLTPSYLKRHQENAGQIFSVFSQTIESNSIDFGKTLKILKDISPFINEERSFSFYVVNLIVQTYEEQSKKQDSYSNLMVDCFLILSKVIYYQKDIDILINLKLMKILIHAKVNLPSKMVDQYYDTFLLLAKLVQKCGQYEIQMVSKDQLMKIIQGLLKQYPSMQFNIPASQNYITSVFLNHIFNQNFNLFNNKEFSIKYLEFILKVCIYCSPQVLIQNLKRIGFFYYLSEAIEHMDPQINYMALQIVLSLIKSQTNSSQFFTLLKEYTQIEKILQYKLTEKTNSRVQQKILTIFQVIDQFNSN